MQNAALQRGQAIEQSQLEKFARSAAQKAKLERQKFAPQHKVGLCFIGMVCRHLLFCCSAALLLSVAAVCPRRSVMCVCRLLG